MKIGQVEKVFPVKVVSAMIIPLLQIIIHRQWIFDKSYINRIIKVTTEDAARRPQSVRTGRYDPSELEQNKPRMTSESMSTFDIL